MSIFYLPVQSAFNKNGKSLSGAKLWFFERMGWDERGVPTEKKLQELGLESFAGALPN